MKKNHKQQVENFVSNITSCLNQLKDLENKFPNSIDVFSLQICLKEIYFQTSKIYTSNYIDFENLLNHIIILNKQTQTTIIDKQSQIEFEETNKTVTLLCKFVYQYLTKK